MLADGFSEAQPAGHLIVGKAKFVFGNITDELTIFNREILEQNIDWIVEFKNLSGYFTQT